MNKRIRYDVVGSFLRPEALKKARKQYEAGQIGQEALSAVEDEAIRELVEKQIHAKLPYVTDGEFRRALWHLDFFWGLQGIERRILDTGYRFQGLVTRGDTATITGRIGGVNHPFVGHFRFVQKLADGRIGVKQTFPAPAQLLLELQRPENVQATQAIYPDQNVLKQDIVCAYTTFIQELYEAGCRVIQLDDCTWGGFLSGNDFAKNLPQAVVDEILNTNLALNNAVLASVPDGMVVSTHVCRGNYRSHYAFSGGYERVAPVLLAKERVDRFYLEFDDMRSGSFLPLAKTRPEASVVLGLITTKKATLEKKQAVLTRLEEAAQILPKERLALSPQCGFASTEEGNLLSEEEQWAKIRLVRELAEDFWGE